MRRDEDAKDGNVDKGNDDCGAPFQSIRRTSMFCYQSDSIDLFENISNRLEITNLVSRALTIICISSWISNTQQSKMRKRTGTLEMNLVISISTSKIEYRFKLVQLTCLR